MATTRSEIEALLKAAETETKGTSVCVRLNSMQYTRLSRDSDLYGKSTPSLLRSVYFSGPMMAPLLAKSDERAILVALSRVGTNLNQIARKLNIGLSAGFNAEFTACREAFEALNAFFRRACADCNPPAGGIGLGHG